MALANEPTKAPQRGPALPPPPTKQELNLQKDQLAILEETHKLVMWKMTILQKLDTIPLIEQLHGQEQTITKLMQDELKFKGENRGYIAGATDDCTVVKNKLAELWVASDGMLIGDGSKKATQTDREAWLRRQRTEDKDLAVLILKQIQVQAGIEGFKIDLETAKRKLDSTLAVIRLKTAQIEFLGRSI